MAERQQHHRLSLELYAVTSNSRRSWAGLLIGGTVALVALAMSGLVAIRASPAARAVLGVADVATLAGVFAYGSKSQRDERAEKVRIMAGQQPSKDR